MRGPLLLALALAAAGCGRPEAPPSAAPPPSPPPAAPVVLFLGTSLTAGLGLDPDHAYPALIQRRIGEAGLPHRVVNAGVSGETSAGARSRIDWLLAQPVDVLVVETGANDALRGQEPDATRANIQAILDAVRARPRPPRVVLVGMQAPSNMGADYARRFREVYPDLARRNDVALVPFLLEGVAGLPALNQPDGIHPTAEGHRRMADTVWAVLEPLLRTKA
ncbi:MAG TPA: arylesterase [Vicinamibacteria bacterium]|jgi:acyl-CoA thioesterase-1